MNLTVEQRVQKAYVAIMHNPKYIALSGVLMIGEYTVRDDVPTAQTNGRDIEFGREFVDSLSDAELRFLILHETYHKMYRHLITWKHLHDVDGRCANMACDYVINIKLTDENPDGWAVMPKVGLLDAKYRGWDAAKVFWDIYDKDDQGGGGSGNDSGESMDSHDWDGAQDMDAKEQRELAREIDQAIRQGALVAGKVGGEVSRDLTELMQPQVDWREVLREFVTDTCKGDDYGTWSRPNRRHIGNDMYMPTTLTERVDELVLAIDTSGSINQRDLTTFLSEVVSICEVVTPERIRLLYWDTQVARDEVYERGPYDQLASSTKTMGGGGTDVSCVPTYLRDNQISTQAVIALTDGYLYAGWGEWSCPVLWCILDNERAVPTCGQQLHIKSL